MPMTIKIDEETNQLLEAYLAWQRAQGLGWQNGKRLKKEDISNRSIRAYVTSNLPPSVLKSLFKQTEKPAGKES